ncbi:MAG: DMT family transporter [Methanococcaceae archaeon]
MKSKISKYRKPLLAVIFWGASFIATKVALNELGPLSIIFLRLLFAIILLSAYAVYTRQDFTINIKNHGRIFLLALIAVFHLWIQVTGLKYTSAANTGWIIGLTPVFMALLGFSFFKEALSVPKIIGIFISFAGLILLISKADFHKIDFITNKGDFMVLASSFTWSIYSIVNKRIAVDYSPLLTTLFLFIMMALLISPFTINQAAIAVVMHLSFNGWISILFLGIFCSGIAYVFWAQALKEMESTRVGVFLYFEPFVTVFTAWILLKEEITLLMILSGLIITAGVLLVNFNFKQWKRKFPKAM